MNESMLLQRGDAMIGRDLLLAIGRGALVKHRESCEACSEGLLCVVAQAHMRAIADLKNRKPSKP